MKNIDSAQSHCLGTGLGSYCPGVTGVLRIRRVESVWGQTLGLCSVSGNDDGMGISLRLRTSTLLVQFVWA